MSGGSPGSRHGVATDRAIGGVDEEAAFDGLRSKPPCQGPRARG